MRWTIFVALMGCTAAGSKDLDGDGEPASVDCNDLDIAVGEPSSWFIDADGDGAGDANSVQVACDAPEGHVPAAGDCDDADPSVYPDAIEACNAVDDNCDGIADNGVQKVLMFEDVDGDGYGIPAGAREACPGEEGWTDVAGDCDDTNGDVHPLAPETCDGIDEDCNGVRDDGAIDAGIWYADADGDSYGNTDVWALSCGAVEGYVENGTDCDDGVATIHPAAEEVCNLVDDDCDESIDDNASDVYTWYEDADGDSYGDSSATVEDCAAPDGYVAVGEDCDDGTSAISPETVWYADADGDGFGSSVAKLVACDPPNGYVRVASDCDDSSVARHPGAAEVCNGADDDCDGVMDGSNATDAVTWYRDADGDSYGDPGIFGRSCAAPEGFVSIGDDCDDAAVSVNPGQIEVCDEQDNDCDGDQDDDDVDVSGIPIWYVDADSDGYGGLASKIQCEEPVGYVSEPGDCDDGDGFVSPGRDEHCNGFDDDCDALVDGNDPSNLGDDTWYADADDDGYGTPEAVLVTCIPPSGWNLSAGDCDDADADVNPDATEVCNDGVDNDCDGSAGPCSPAGSSVITDAFDARWNGTASTDKAGDRISDYADVSGDSISEWLISALEADRTGASGAGAVYVVPGTDLGTFSLSTSRAIWQGPTASAGFGAALDGIGDWNSDGFADIVVGSTKVDDGGTDSGAVYVLSGTTTGTTVVSAGTAIAIFRGEDASDNAGTGASSAGDVDGDGFEDLWIGAPGDDLSVSSVDRGAAYLMFGPVAGTLDLGLADVKLVGGEAGDGAGTVVRGGVDADGDGIPDALIGAPKEGSSDRGSVYLVTDIAGAAGASSLDTGAVRMSGVESSGYAGTSVDFAGDVNDDGYEDFVIGAPSAIYYQRGQAYVALGPVESTLYLEDADAIFEGEANYDYVGSSVSAAGDINGDQVDDVLIGSDGYNSYRGRAVVVLGQIPLGRQMLTAAADVAWTGASTYDYLGSTVGGVGDVNGDGRSDIAIQAPSMTTPSTDAGSIFLILGQGL